MTDKSYLVPCSETILFMIPIHMTSKNLSPFMQSHTTDIKIQLLKVSLPGRSSTVPGREPMTTVSNGLGSLIA
jgi:hypothetical protein